MARGTVASGLRRARAVLARRRSAREAVPADPFGPLPDFVIAGAMKAGTTATSLNLRKHPRVFMADHEPHFFDQHWDRGVAWYRSLFAGGEGLVCGEKTPGLMFRREWMERVRSVVPDARIIVLLREPIARMLSHVNHLMDRDQLPATEEISVEYLRVNLFDQPRWYESVVRRSLYVEHLQQNVLSLFPAERVLIKPTDGATRNIDRDALEQGRGQMYVGWTDDPAATGLFLDICRFLGIEPPPRPEKTRIAGARRYRAAVSPKVRDFLYAFYEEPNRRLFDVLGEEISAWSYEHAVAARA